MKTFTHFAMLLLLIAGLGTGTALAQSADLAAPGPDGETVYSNWHEALKASPLGLDDVVEAEPLSYEAIQPWMGVALYRMQNLETGEIAFAKIRVPTDPTVVGPGEVDAGREGAGLTTRDCAPESYACNAPLPNYYVPDSSRCAVTLYRDANFSGDNFSTYVDLNTFYDIQWPGHNYGVNDNVSSIRTNCNAAWFFKDKNWGGTSYYVPANTGVANLGSLNDQLTSMWHVIP